MINLADSTNRWGTAPAAHAALADALLCSNDYPSALGDALKGAAARYIGVEPREVVTGCGSDNVLDAAIRAFSSPGDLIAWTAPTFAMMPSLAGLQRLRIAEVSFGRGGALDVEALLEQRAVITYVCAPNNPTGAMPSRESLERLASEAPGLVIIDEAYAEFAGASVASLAPAWRGTLVTRTLSKAFGLAGLRAGYGVAAADVIRRIERARGPFTLSRVAEQVGAVALERDQGWMRAHAAEAIANRERLGAELRALGFAPLPSAANFLCVPVENAGQVAVELGERGIAVRAFSGLRDYGDVLRIAVAPWEQLEVLLGALSDLARGNGT